MDHALIHSVNIRRAMRGATMAELPKEECVVVKVVTVESAVKEVNIILKDWRPSEKKNTLILQALRLISIKFLLVIYQCFIKQGGHGNYGHDPTR